MTIDPQLRNWLLFFCILLLSGVGAGYGLREIQASQELWFFSAAGWVVILLLSFNVFQAATTRRRAQRIAEYLTQDLAASKGVLLELFRNSPVPYLMIKRDGTVTNSNNAALRLFGVEQGMLEGKQVFSMLEGEDPQHFSFIPARVRSGNYINDEVARVMHSDASFHWVLLSTFPFGRKNEALMTLVDITKQKEIEAAKTEFVSLASHQLRTPISSMKWNVELLTSDKFGPVSEAQQKYITKIERGLVKMNNIINDFLDASQLELGTFATQPSSVHLRTFLDDIADEFVERVAQKQINFVKQYGEEDITLTIDEHLLHMVVSNLSSNAVKYTPEQGSVTLAYQSTASNLTITVTDTGMGIPLAEQENLFGKFFRASNAKSSVTQGTGLGLYIVKRAVEHLDGEISFVSEANQGTTFTIVLPR